MKTVQDHPGYAEAADLLQRLQDKHTELTQEQQELLAQLRFKEPEQVAYPSDQDRALAVLEGKPMPSGRVGIIDDLRDRELAIRGELEILNAALRTQPQTVEQQRTAARAAALALRSKELAKVSRAWEAAEDALRAALATEDALTNDLLDGGFGYRFPAITSPAWLNRDHAKAELMA